MVKVTFEFPTIDHAIVAMSKLVGAPAPSVKAAEPAQAPAAAPATQRKPRDDAGKPRGKYKARGQTAEAGEAGTQAGKAKSDATDATVGSAPTPPAVSPAEAPIAEAPAAAPPPAPSPAGNAPVASAPVTKGQAQAALERVFSEKGLAAAKAVLDKFGVNRLGELPADKYAEFVAAAA